MIDKIIEIIGCSPTDDPIGFMICVVLLFAFMKIITDMLMVFMGYEHR